MIMWIKQFGKKRKKKKKEGEKEKETGGKLLIDRSA